MAYLIISRDNKSSIHDMVSTFGDSGLGVNTLRGRRISRYGGVSRYGGRRRVRSIASLRRGKGFGDIASSFLHGIGSALNGGLSGLFGARRRVIQRRHVGGVTRRYRHRTGVMGKRRVIRRRQVVRRGRGLKDQLGHIKNILANSGLTSAIADEYGHKDIGSIARKFEDAFSGRTPSVTVTPSVEGGKRHVIRRRRVGCARKKVVHRVHSSIRRRRIVGGLMRRLLGRTVGIHSGMRRRVVHSGIRRRRRVIRRRL